MPVYRYRCVENQAELEVVHRMTETLRTWGELCALLGREVGDTRPEAAVERILFAPNLSSGAGLPSNSELAAKGFTKLVRREKGVYENVTAGSGQRRFVRAPDGG